MRKIFLPLTIILLLLFCAPAFAQKIKPPADCNVSAGEITVTHSSPTIKCPGVNSTTLVLNGNDEGDIVWFSSVDGEIWELVEGVTGTQYVASNLLDTTYFIVEVRNGPGTCWGYSNIVRISISMPVWYKDGDGDHYADTVHQCTKPGIGYTITPIAPPGDCNDSDGSIHPGAPEIIDGIDNDCDGSIDEGYSNTGFEDVIIPNGISSIAITVQGAKGGSIKKQDTHGGDLVGSPAIVASGGRGARLNAKFRVETDCQQGLKPGGKLRFIIGGTPDAIIRNQEVPSLPGVAPTSSGQGGGGGTAILYQAPGTSSWVLLAVAGGGGGAFSRNDGLNSFNSNGIAAIQPGFNLTTTGPDGMGGKGIFIQQIIPDDDPRDGGQIIIINISGGGGGAFGDATQSCGGKKGMDEGGTSTICTSGSAGGYGFGAGGSGISRLDNPSTPADNEEGGGGGGGGYSGGNGGGNATGGFGGGSYISDLAFESSWLTSSSADNGSIIIETNPIDNSDCCDPESLAFTGSYADVNLGCNPADPDASLGTATATDASGAVTITSTDGPVISDGCNCSRTRTFTATDGCNNTVTTSRTVRWVADLTPPSFTGSYAEVNLGCNPANPDGSLGSASATDVCGAVTITSSDGAVVIDGCNRSRTRTFTATDGCLNTSTTSRTVKWIFDDTPPEFTGSYADINLGCNPAFPEGALGTATATDACGEVTITSAGLGTIYDGCNRSISRRFIARDKCGNQSFITRTVRWIVDLIPPTFTGSYADVNLGCNPASPDGSLGTATATDVCGDVTIMSSDEAVVSDGCNRSRTRTFTATDGCLNTSTTSRTVRWITDVTPPSFTGSYADVNLGCNPANPDGSLGTATATDVCGAVTITSSDGAVQSNGCNRSRTRTFTATDGCLNTSTTSRTVRWIYDVTAPTLTSGGSTLTLGWNPNVDQIEAALGTATATDACSNPTVTPSNGSVTGDCLKSQTRTFRAIDACGNISTVSREVTWKFDLTVPTVNCPSNQTVNLSPNCTASLPNYISLATASDNCTVPGSITITQYPAAETPLSGTGTQTVTLTATDEAGNTATCSFTVNKVDNTPPVINNASPGICVLSPPNHKMRDVTVTYTTSDACGPVSSSLQVSSNEPISGTGDGDTAPDWEVIDNHNVKLRAERSGSGDGRVYTITITATDASGNTSTSSVEVRVTHNITSPQSGKSFKVGSTVNLEGEFWDKAGNKHSATWLIDDNTTVKGTVTEPTATKNGKVTGSYKFTAPGVYKLQMNTKDQNNVVSYANTSGDVDAIIVIYDPNGGFTYGGGYFNSPAGAVTSNASATGKGSYGFSVNYFKGATYPKGETQFDFKVGEFEFNALNFEYLSIAGAKAQMKGTGKIIGGQSGINFILTVTDGQLDGTGIDRIRMKIYNKNTMEVYYDNQPGASDAVNPTVPVQENSTVVISGSNNSNLTQSNQVTTNVEQEVAPLADGLQVKVMPNPSSTNFRIVVNSNDLKSPVKLLVTDMLGRVVETRITNAGQTITIGDKYISGTYAVRIIQGRRIRQLTLIKLSD